MPWPRPRSSVAISSRLRLAVLAILAALAGPVLAQNGAAPAALFRVAQVESVANVDRVFPSPVDANTLYLWTEDGLQISHDAAASFSAPDPNLTRQLGAITALLISPIDTNILYAGTAGQGVFVSRDGGVSFRPLGGVEQGLAHPQVFALAFAPNDSSFNTIYASHGFAHPGLSVTDNGGKTWRSSGAGFAAGDLAVTDDGLFLAGTSPAQGTGFFRYALSSDWFCVLLGKPTVVLPSTMTPGQVWFGTQSGLRVSEDGGQTMRLPNPGPPGADIVSLAPGFDLDHGETIFAYDPTGAGVLCSRDNGKTFQPCNDGLEPTDWIKRGANLAADTDGSVLYACRNGHLYRGAQRPGPVALSSVRVLPAVAVPGEDPVTFTCRAKPGATVTLDCSTFFPGVTLDMQEQPARDLHGPDRLFLARVPMLPYTIFRAGVAQRAQGPVILPVHATLGHKAETRYAAIRLMPRPSDSLLWRGSENDVANFINTPSVILSRQTSHPRSEPFNLHLSTTGPGTACLELGRDWDQYDALTYRLLGFYIRSDQPGPPDLKISIRSLTYGQTSDESYQTSHEVDLSRYLPKVSNEYQFVAIPLADMIFGSPCPTRGARQVLLHSNGAGSRSYDFTDFELIAHPAPQLRVPGAIVASDGRSVRFRVAASTRFGSVHGVLHRLADGRDIPLIDDGRHTAAGEAVYTASVPTSGLAPGPQPVMFWADDDRGRARAFVELFVPPLPPAIMPRNPNGNPWTADLPSYANCPPIHLADKANPAVSLDARCFHRDGFFCFLFDVTDPGFTLHTVQADLPADKWTSLPSIEMFIRSPISADAEAPLLDRDHHVVLLAARPATDRVPLGAVDNNRLNCSTRKTERGYELQVTLHAGFFNIPKPFRGCDFDIGRATRFDLILHASDGSTATWAAPDAATAAANPDSWGLLEFTDTPGAARITAYGAVGHDLLLTCNKQLDPVAATNPASYQCANHIITAATATLDSNIQTIRLTASTPWTDDPACTLTFPDLRTREDQGVEPLTCAVVPATVADDGLVRECLVGPPTTKIDPRVKLRDPVFQESEQPVADSAWKVAAASGTFDLPVPATGSELTAVPVHLYVYSDGEHNVRFWLGATGGVRLIVDGNRLLVEPASARPCVPDEEKSPKFMLRKGWHDLMLTITHSTGPCQFCLRIRGENGGAPEGLAYSARRPW